MRVLVAGGAGFVGSHLCRRLVADGQAVICLDNLVTGSLANIADLEGHSGFAFVGGDVEQAATVPVDLVYHLASPASPVDYVGLPLETLSANSRGTWRLLELARAAGARLVYASTSEVYGDPLVHPQTESYWGNVDPVGPRSCYDEGKRFGEALISSFRQVHSLPARIARIFNTYGPSMRRDDGRVMPELLGAALAGLPLRVHGDGAQTRSFMYVRDLVDALVRLGFEADGDGEIFNVGNPREVTILELAETIRVLVAPNLPIEFVPARPGDPQRRRPDISKVRSAYGWEPRVTLEEGLQLTLGWMRSHSQALRSPTTDTPRTSEERLVAAVDRS